MRLKIAATKAFKSFVRAARIFSSGALNFHELYSVDEKNQVRPRLRLVKRIIHFNVAVHMHQSKNERLSEAEMIQNKKKNGAEGGLC